MRTAIENRKTKETSVTVELNLDGTGQSEITTGIGFFDHILTALSKYSLIDIKILAKGDLETGTHHTIEDVGIVLGLALAKALGEKKAINRAGWFEFRYMMDDAIAESIIDLSGRGRLVFEGKNNNNLQFSNESVGSIPSEEIREFFLALAENMKANIAIRLTRSGNSHHEVEAVFKAFGKALRMAVENDPRSRGQIPSTKGVI
ncbi:Imidazoleglycerol-phosphate dehydratase [Candidatus Bilamarchaeum dharawalense]|uniref:Imidazoleglycerol-phosphate dehydratase n=1 Tax=Candidatus Bilamarchaeum dharawalense TaxID=2885759 RepID=A0A5E4LPY7_9ARCH|nr:Imidazoleglycerol-phosphate dehydratase [Candidatus Bilamarchaeum dharawalense]